MRVGRVAGQAFSPEQVSRGDRPQSVRPGLGGAGGRGLFVHRGSLVKKGVWPELGGGAKRDLLRGSRRLHLPALEPLVVPRPEDPMGWGGALPHGKRKWAWGPCVGVISPTKRRGSLTGIGEGSRSEPGIRLVGAGCMSGVQ